MQSINFKVSKEMAEELDRRAEKYNERSRHLYARRAVEEYLKDSRQHQIEYAMKEIRDQIEMLRDELATAMGMLLVHDGPVEDVQEVLQRVSEAFRP